MRTLQHKFLEFIPSELEDGIIYITMQYRTAVHKCVCGCGNKVITPITPSDWKITFDGRTVTFYPSIGNWNFPCRSHYWIKNSRVEYVLEWSISENKSTIPVKKKGKKRRFKWNWKKLR